MKKTRIIIILSILLVISICFNVILLINKNTSDEANENDNENTQNSKVVGIYHTDRWTYGLEGVLELYEDGTCKYPGSSFVCTYEVNDDNITICEHYYQVYTSTGELADTQWFKEIEDCEEHIQHVKDNLNSDASVCKDTAKKYEATLTNNGLILSEHEFTKIK